MGAVAIRGRVVDSTGRAVPGARVATLVVVASFVVYAAHFNADGNKLRAAYEAELARA